jgi:REP element-mobilizing transposase RayT
MPQSLARVLIHVAFSSKDRQPVFTTEIQKELWPYLATVARAQGNLAIEIGGHTDHTHLLLSMARTVTIAQIVENLKTSSSKMLKTKVPGFSWQSGYGAFSLGQREVETVSAYIRNQESHHKKASFQDEFREICKECGIEYDERYVWD